MTITGEGCVGSGVESRCFLMYIIYTLEPLLFLYNLRRKIKEESIH